LGDGRRIALVVLKGAKLKRRWFLSYHSPDQMLAERLKAAIESKDPDSSVFFAPASLRAGGFWSAQLAQGIADATAFILLVGEKGVGDWQMLEYTEALEKRVKRSDFPVVLVLLEGQAAPGLPFLRSLHWIISPDPASDRDVTRLFDAAGGAGASPAELWRYTSPYRGLVAMQPEDSDYFFGRERETAEVLATLAAAPDKIAVLLGNSGVGKSSLAQAGVIAALMRQAWPERAPGIGDWPAVFRDSRRWCFLTLRPGAVPVRSLVEVFLETWQLDRTSTAWPQRRAEWVDGLLADNLSLCDLLDQTKRRHAELEHSEPPAYLIYIDQGEELYVRAETRQRRRFSELLAEDLSDPRLFVLMSLRADFFGELQKDEPLYRAHELISVPPLREAELRQVVSRPADLLSARFETDRLPDIIARRAAEESTKDAGALPLLSYLLDDMWKSRDAKWDGVLRLPAPAIDLGRVLVDRADAFMVTHSDDEDMLRRIFTLKLSTVRQDGEPTRRRAVRAEFSGEEWRLVSELADHPNRLLVTVTPEAGALPATPTSADAKPSPSAGETYAEVAHEAIFRRWDRLRDWIAAEREFLAWRTGLEAARCAFEQTPSHLKKHALLMGFALTQAQRWLATHPETIHSADRDFIMQSRTAALWRQLRNLGLAGGLGLVIACGVTAWLNEAWLLEQWRWFTVSRPYMLTQVRPHVLTADAERSLKPRDSFKECAKDCPEMVVIPPGKFIMGSPEGEEGHTEFESPQHEVTLARPFAVGKFAVTFEEWDACAANGECDRNIRDAFGRGRQPVINITWDDAQTYVAWLSKMTGRAYRLLTEAEYEYAARAGTRTAYYWGEDIGENNANCNKCGSEWDRKQPAPVGSFKPNEFGLHDMLGNVFQWVEDCDHGNYEGAPQDGSAWIEPGRCSLRLARGGAFNYNPHIIRAAFRNPFDIVRRDIFLGFRIGRTLDNK